MVCCVSLKLPSACRLYQDSGAMIAYSVLQEVLLILSSIDLMDVDTTVVEWIFLNLVVGLGTGVLFPSMAFSIQAAVDVQHIAVAVAFFSFFRGLGQGLGIAVGGSIFQNQIKQKIMNYPLLAPLAGQYSQDATALVGIIRNMPLGEARDQLMQAYADSLKIVWVVMCALAAVAGFASIFISHYSMDQVLVTKQGFKGASKEIDAEAGTKRESEKPEAKA